jgi:uncharacterized protein YbjT (DUF2867 family)
MTQHNRETVLVVGATGTVGGAAVRSLLAKGANVRAFVRSSSSAARGLDSGAELVRGDLRDGMAVRTALAGVRAAFYVSPHEPDEEQLGQTFIQACESARVRLVFVGVHIDGATRPSRALRRLLFGRWLPHYAPKFRIAERARTSRADPIVLMPSNFFQNDEIFRRELLQGSFLQPFARPINRVDVRDIGDAAAHACLEPSLASGAYPVVGPESLDGRACAAAWSRALTRTVTYEDDDSRFRAAVARELLGKKADDFVASYAAIRKLHIPTPAKDLTRTTALLGRSQTPYSAYVHDAANRLQQTAGRQ